MRELQIKDFMKEVWETNEAHGFHNVNTTPAEYLALIHSEVSETLRDFGGIQIRALGDGNILPGERREAGGRTGGAGRHCYPLFRYGAAVQRRPGSSH